MDLAHMGFVALVLVVAMVAMVELAVVVVVVVVLAMVDDSIGLEIVVDTHNSNCYLDSPFVHHSNMDCYFDSNCLADVIAVPKHLYYC
jgi:hypothetical protein